MVHACHQYTEVFFPDTLISDTNYLKFSDDLIYLLKESKSVLFINLVEHLLEVLDTLFRKVIDVSDTLVGISVISRSPKPSRDVGSGIVTVWRTPGGRLGKTSKQPC